MDITQLRYFLKTAELLNYSRAAESLFITRQSLRQAIGTIEKELGAALFSNEHNHLSLTDCGAYLAMAGEGVVRSFDRMWEDAVGLASRKVTLKVAFAESLVPFFLPDSDRVLERFQARFPHIPLEVHQWDMDRVVEMAEAGEIDCGCVLQMPCDHPGCAVRTLASFPAVLDFGEGSPLLEHPQTELALEELDGLPAIGMGSPRRFLRPLWEDCLSRDIRLNYQVVPNTIDAFYQIQNGLAAGFDILDKSSLGSRPIYSLPLPGYSFELVLLCSRNGPGPAELLYRFLEEELKPPFLP